MCNDPPFARLALQPELAFRHHVMYLIKLLLLGDETVELQLLMREQDREL